MSLSRRLLLLLLVVVGHRLPQQGDVLDALQLARISQEPDFSRKINKIVKFFIENLVVF